jgi:small GTP-binding protein
MSQKFKYDVFLSHSSKDKPVVRELAKKLKADGVRVWFDEWIIKPGDSIPIKISEGLRDSRVLVLAISANASESDWVTFEHQSILFNDPINKTRRFIPLRLDDSEIQFALRQFAYIDWVNHDEEQYERLLTVGREDVETHELENKDTEIQKIGTTRILKEYAGAINSAVISSNNQLIVAGTGVNTVRIWETESGNRLKILQGHSDIIREIAISSNNQFIVSGSADATIRIWEVATGKCLKVLKGHLNEVNTVKISSNNKFIISGSSDSTVRIWEVETGKCLNILRGHLDWILGVAISSNDKFIVSSSRDQTVRIWEIETGKCLKILRTLNVNFRVVISTDNKFIISGSSDFTVRIWEVETGKCLNILEGHSNIVQEVAISTDNKFIVSGSEDHTVRIWEMETGKCLKILRGHFRNVKGVAITSDNKFIISCSVDETIRIWNISSFADDFKYSTAIKSNAEYEKYKFYTNAKVLLVGDSGVGKSGLANRITQNKFVETISTDGVWATQMKLPHDTNTDDTEREIWLWDFAGQSDYRLIHQLFMDETSLAVLVFNPQADNPFEGLGQWDRDLQRAASRPFKKLLVAGRCDRGSLTVSRKTLDDFKDEREFAKYLETSALTGEGCNDLRQAIIEHINWDDIPYRSSPRIFKLLKEEILKLKDEGRILLTLSELKQNLEVRLSDEKFTFDEFKTVVGLLAGSGVVWQLEFGDFVLLQPERVNSYAAAVVRSVRAHVDEIGCISEERVLKGELDYQDMARLPEKEEEIVLRAMYQTFIERGLCLRELTDAGYLLIFPSYFRRERPPLDKHPSALVTYQFSGMLDEIYATLVVKLHHTSAFDKDQLWRYAADFKTQGGKRVGLKMTKKPEGAAEITIYFEKDIPDDTKAVFIRYVHDHLKAKDENVVRVRHYVCPHCGEQFENKRAIQIRLGKGLKEITCPICDEKFDLWDLIEEKFASDEFQQRVRKMEEESKIAIDNESRELILVGHAYAISGQSGQIFRQTSNSDWGIDGEIEFKDYEGKASGKRVYLQLKSGDSYLRTRKRDEKEIFDIKPRHAEYWQNHNYDVMLVIRTSDDEIRWMNATEYLKKHGKDTRQIIFDGEPFSALNVIRLRDKILGKK